MKPDANQFSVGSILWLTTFTAAILAYAQWIGGPAMNELGIYIVMACVAGGVAGIPRRNFADTLFWALLTNLLVYLAVAGGRLPSEAVMLSWGGVGAVCGALCGIPWPARLVWGLPVTAAVAGVTSACALIVLGEKIEGLIWFDVLCAAAVGFVLSPAIGYLRDFLERSQQPRVVLASWLSLIVLLGNVLVPIIGQVQR